jgi:hypothetical protein
MKRILTGFIAVTMVLTLVGSVGASAQAATAADIAAMIAQLQAQLAAMGGTSTGGHTFSVDLTMGSKGADVTALQNMLIGKGHAIAAGATGYFGAQTKAAVSAWQAANGITPSVGYFGPKSRTAANAAGGTTSTTPTTPGTTPAGVTTVGKEGIMTVTLGATPVPSNIYAGDKGVGILGVQVQAQQSDLDIQRVTLYLGTDNRIYNKIYQTLYVKDPSGAVVATQPLNSTTVTKSGLVYSVTITGFHMVIPAGTTKTFSIAADLYSTIDSTNTDGDTFTVAVANNGVRAVDGAGIDLYGPTDTATPAIVTRTATPAASLVDAASLQLSTDSATPVTGAVVATGGSSSNQQDLFPILTFDLFAQKDNIQVTDVAMTFAKTGSTPLVTATTTTAYLYDGSTLLGSASVTSASTGIATISNITGLWINKDSTKVLTVKTDLRNASTTAAVLSVSIANTQVTALNTQGSIITPSGSAQSNSFTVRNKGPLLTLVGTPTIVKSATGISNNTSTSTVTATFNFQIQALGSDLYFGTQAASTTFGFGTYVGGASAAVAGVASTTSWVIPSTGVVTTGLPGVQVAFKLQQNNTVTIPVTFYFEGKTTTGASVAGNTYAVQFNSLAWSTTGLVADNQTSTYMSALTGWQTASVQLP